VILLYFFFPLLFTCAESELLIERIRKYEDFEDGVAEELIQVIEEFSDTACHLDENVN